MPVIQWIECQIADLVVAGSSPAGHTFMNKELVNHQFEVEYEDRVGVSRPQLKWYRHVLNSEGIKIKTTEIGDIEDAGQKLLAKLQVRYMMIRHNQKMSFKKDFVGVITIGKMIERAEKRLGRVG